MLSMSTMVSSVVEYRNFMGYELLPMQRLQFWSMAVKTTIEKGHGLGDLGMKCLPPASDWN